MNTTACGASCKGQMGRHAVKFSKQGRTAGMAASPKSQVRLYRWGKGWFEADDSEGKAAIDGAAASTLRSVTRRAVKLTKLSMSLSLGSASAPRACVPTL
jgi:hypothetical protein